MVKRIFDFLKLGNFGNAELIEQKCSEISLKKICGICIIQFVIFHLKKKCFCVSDFSDFSDFSKTLF